MHITERQNNILNILIKEYIDSAQPVSSQLLEEKYDFGLSSATIRNEMKALTDAHYLRQPHTSAGRVPTDRGYRFFVNNLLKEDIKQEEIPDFDKFITEITEKAGDHLKFLSEFTKTLAEISSNFTILRFPKKDLLWESGWKEILKEPEFEDRNFVFDFTNFVENLERNIDRADINSNVQIYIGKENPVPKATKFSVIVTKVKFPEEGEGIVSLLGPTRMDYPKNISLLSLVGKLFDSI